MEQIGKIKHVSYGFGGYQDAEFGFSFELGGKSWGVNDFWGTWARDPDQYCKWTVKDQDDAFLQASRRFLDLLRKSGRRDMQALIDVPIRATFEGNRLRSWEIIEDAC